MNRPSTIFRIYGAGQDAKDAKGFFICKSATLMDVQHFRTHFPYRTYIDGE